eukprot:TRINITY_DN12752_c0_g1_i1.p1 TRINITY_DN12752_c0_g1~~TRINITY_DN12752_c0_g1_i1.p1  ORF type:complete len:499 (-),score=60.67 TRINITY_DN12752_c0_g1_i1:649-2145(-)
MAISNFWMELRSARNRSNGCIIQAAPSGSSTCQQFSSVSALPPPTRLHQLGNVSHSRGVSCWPALGFCVVKHKRCVLAAAASGSGGSKSLDEFTAGTDLSPGFEMVMSVPAMENKSRFSEKRTATITVHGVRNDNDVRRLNSLLRNLEGVEDAWIGPFIEGGLRGGSVTLQIEVRMGLRLTDVVKEIQALEHGFLVLPFKYNSWSWRGHKITYGAAGCGKPVILIHGFGGSAGHFSRLISHLADQYRVYAVDLLGFGRSDKPSDVNYGPDLWADVICDFIKEFSPEGAVLIGNSIGSLTALAAASKGGSRAARGLVLLNCAGAMNRKGLSQDGALLRIISPIFMGVEYLLQRPSIASFLFDKFRSKENVKKILQQQAYRDVTAVTSQLVDILHHPSADPGAVDVFVKVFTGEPGPRPEVLMPLIEVPLLLLWGERDRWTPPNGPVANYFRKLAMERDNIQVHVLPDVGHCPHDDRPELAAAHILPFLETVKWDSWIGP